MPSSSYSEKSTSGRPIVEVAVGVLIKPDQSILLGQRPEGKPYAGYWEFPGGKIEAGETLLQALQRELQEEIDVSINDASEFLVIEHDYPHAYVRLHICLVTSCFKFFQYRTYSSNIVRGAVCQLASPQPYINSKQLKEVREKYKIHEKDTGSAEYQIAALSVRIAYLTAHVKKNPKDFSSTRGLIAMVNARKKLLKYLRSQNKDRFLKVCLNLKIRIQKDQQ